MKHYVGHRGDITENILNNIHYVYLLEKKAVINKIPTPVKVMKLEYGRITSAFFETQSTVDYHGAYKGIPICFDAKETEQASFPLKNIHQHQVDYMNDFSKIGQGIAFIICYSKKKNIYFLIPLETINKYWSGYIQDTGRKSIPFSDETIYTIPLRDGLPDYLKIVDKIIGGK